MQKYGGISRYFYEIITNFNNMSDIETSISILFSNNYYLSNKELVEYFNFLPFVEFRGKQKIFNFFNQVVSAKKLKQKNFDLFHPTYYDPYFLKYHSGIPFVLTVHDMIHEKFPNMFSPYDKTSANKRFLAEKAAKIIAISESTKKDIIDLWGVNPTKIDIVYHGNSLSFDNIIDNDFIKQLPKRYVLFVGSRVGYKNFINFLEATSILLMKDKELSLICVGGGHFTELELKKIKALNIANQVYQYNTNDKILSSLYHNAVAFVFPSLYEGFGLPVLEAFACECPVLCSNTSSFTEIGDNAVLYFDPYDKDSMLQAMQKIIYDDALRKLLILKGKEQLSKFSWKKTAIETKKVYKSIINDL